MCDTLVSLDPYNRLWHISLSITRNVYVTKCRKIIVSVKKGIFYTFFSFLKPNNLKKVNFHFSLSLLLLKSNNLYFYPIPHLFPFSFSHLPTFFRSPKQPKMEKHLAFTFSNIYPTIPVTIPIW